ncbi:glutathione S-transferase [soil metagenome]
MLKILGRPDSINVRKATWLCAELDIPFEQQAWGSGHRSTFETEFLALNPNGLVPVLVDGEFVLWESNTICRYLAARENRTDWLPTDARSRARIEQWMDWQAGELNNSWRHAFLGLVRKFPKFLDPAAIEASVAAWNKHMQILEAQLQRTGAYVTGATITTADIGIGLAVNRWFGSPIERPVLPAVEQYYARLKERPAYRLHGANGEP